MSKVSNENIIKLKDTLTVNSAIKTANLCVDGFCVREKDLYFLPDIPRADRTKIYYENLDITENELYKLKKFWFEGMVISFYGRTEDIPEGWALCDGRNGTPDLQNKFVIGSGGKYSVGDTGGEESVKLKEDQLPRHRHTFNPSSINTYEKHQPYSSSCDETSKKGLFSTCTSYIPLTDTNMYTGTTKVESFSRVGKSRPHNNIPPYYGLYYIMKLKEKEV